MTGLLTVRCYNVGMGWGIVLLEGKIVSDRLDLEVNDFIHKALVCKCAPSNNQADTAKYVN